MVVPWGMRFDIATINYPFDGWWKPSLDKIGQNDHISRRVNPFKKCRGGSRDGLVGSRVSMFRFDGDGSFYDGISRSEAN